MKTIKLPKKHPVEKAVRTTVYGTLQSIPGGGGIPTILEAIAPSQESQSRDRWEREVTAVINSIQENLSIHDQTGDPNQSPICVALLDTNQSTQLLSSENVSSVVDLDANRVRINFDNHAADKKYTVHLSGTPSTNPEFEDLTTGGFTLKFDNPADKDGSMVSVLVIGQLA